MVVKRIVLRHPDGMMEILGLTKVQPPTMLEHNGAPICLVAAKRGYYLYRFIMLPQQTRRFNDGQV